MLKGGRSNCLDLASIYRAPQGGLALVENRYVAVPSLPLSLGFFLRLGPSGWSRAAHPDWRLCPRVTCAVLSSGRARASRPEGGAGR